MANRKRPVKKAVRPLQRTTEEPDSAVEEPGTEDATDTTPVVGTAASDEMEGDSDPFEEDEGDGIEKEPIEATPDGTENTISSSRDGNGEVGTVIETRASQFLEKGLFKAEYAVPSEGFTDEFHEKCLRRTEKNARAQGLRTRGGAFRTGFRHNKARAVYAVHVRS